MNTRQQVEIELLRWLRSHHGIISYYEALRLGATPKMIQSKLQRGEWVRVHRGVYRHAATAQGPWQDLRAATVLCAGGRGVVSHASAAWAWGLLRQPPELTEITVRRGERDVQARAGIAVHRSSDLDVAQAVQRNAVLVTNPLRTLVDVAGSALPRDLTEAVDTALARRLLGVPALEAEIARLSRPGRTGVGALRSHLRQRGFIGAPEPSVLESHTLRLIRSTELPDPSVERRVGEDGEYRLDFTWDAIVYAVEVDGYAFHFSPEHQQRDLNRRNKLRRAGWTLDVYTWMDVMREPSRVAREVTATHRQLSSSR
ncbi:MAG: hypothetical protein QOF81_248 [Acidimicrobiaceae bacterium]|nr:hypothetical protein [Acidimicrobiaceae bacterium]